MYEPTQHGGQYINPINEYTATTNYTVPVVQPQFQSFTQVQQEVTTGPIYMFIDLFGEEQGRVIYTELASIRRPNGEYLINIDDFDQLVEVIKLCIYHKNYITARDELVQLASDPLSEIPWSFSNMTPYGVSYIDSINLEFQEFVKRVRPDGSECPNKLCKGKYIYSIANQVTKSGDEGTTDHAKCSNCGLPYEPDYNVYV